MNVNFVNAGNSGLAGAPVSGKKIESSNDAALNDSVAISKGSGDSLFDKDARLKKFATTQKAEVTSDSAQDIPDLIVKTEFVGASDHSAGGWVTKFMKADAPEQEYKGLMVKTEFVGASDHSAGAWINKVVRQDAPDVAVGLLKDEWAGPADHSAGGMITKFVRAES